MVVAVMQFGKHRGQPITEVPTRYLTWLAEQRWLKQPMRLATQTELKRRLTSGDDETLLRILERSGQPMTEAVVHELNRRYTKREKRRKRTSKVQQQQKAKYEVLETDAAGNPTRISYGLAPIHYDGPIVDDGTIPFTPNV